MSMSICTSRWLVVLAGAIVILVQSVHGVVFLVGVLKLLVLLPTAQGRGAAKSIVDVVLVMLSLHYFMHFEPPF